VVNADHPDSAIRIRGVVSRDQQEAVFIFTQLVTSVSPCFRYAVQTSFSRRAPKADTSCAFTGAASTSFST